MKRRMPEKKALTQRKRPESGPFAEYAQGSRYAVPFLFSEAARYQYLSRTTTGDILLTPVPDGIFKSRGAGLTQTASLRSERDGEGDCTGQLIYRQRVP